MYLYMTWPVDERIVSTMRACPNMIATAQQGQPAVEMLECWRLEPNRWNWKIGIDVYENSSSSSLRSAVRRCWLRVDCAIPISAATVSASALRGQSK
jgi:hypothetical protein